MMRLLLASSFALLAVGLALAQAPKTSARPGPEPPAQELSESEKQIYKAAIELAATNSMTAPPSDTFEILDGAARELGLTQDQRQAIGQIDEVARKAIRAAMLNGKVNFKEPLNERRQRDERRRAEIAAHAERLALDVLTEEQLEKLKAIRWTRKGVRALQDRELADHLGLSRPQREELSRRFQAMEQVRQDAESRITAIPKGVNPDSSDVAENAYAEANQESRNRLAAAEDEVLSVLSPHQLERWRRLIVPAFNRRGGR
jgi:hypothetical protein